MLAKNKNQQRDPTSKIISHPLLIPQPLPPSQVVNPLWINIGKNNAKKFLISTLLDGGMMQISHLMLLPHLITKLCGTLVAGNGFKGPSVHDLMGSLLQK